MLIDAGKQAEYLFASAVLGRGLVPFWPSTQMQAIDLVVASASRAYRVQIKATQKSGNAIAVSAQMKSSGKRKRYTSKEVDFVAVYVFTHSLWYVIPVNKIKGMAVYLRPEDPQCPFARFKEAWALFK